MRPLSPLLAQIALEELNEMPNRIQQDLAILREWLAKQNHLHARTTDAFLIAFLRYCRYSLEETKQRINNYFQFYNMCPEMCNRTVNERILALNRTGIHYYPEFPMCNNQRALLIVRFAKVCPKKYNFRDILFFNTMAMEMMAMESDNASVAGVCEVLDLAGASLDAMTQFDGGLYKKWSYWMENCCPLRIRELYVINAPKEVQSIISIIRSVIPKKSFEKEVSVLMLKTTDDLYEYVPRKCLPEEYGGSNGHVAECVAYMEDLLKSYRSYFNEDIKYGALEQLRSGKLFTYEAGFGAEGSFRKLSIE